MKNKMHLGHKGIDTFSDRQLKMYNLIMYATLINEKFNSEYFTKKNYIK